MTELMKVKVQLPHGGDEQFARFGPGWTDLWIREGTSDDDVLREIWIEDCYRVRGIDKREWSKFVPDNVVQRGWLGSTVIDIGACTGMFSALCLAYGAEQVIAVEPEPDNLDLLQRNIGRRAQRVTVLAGAVCGGSERLALVGGEGTGHTRPVDDGPPEREVAAYYVSEIIDAARLPIALMKCDVEGAEYAAMLACDSEHLGRVERIVMETHGPEQHPWVEEKIGALVEHLLATHAVEVFGYPQRGGMLIANRYPT